jgi:organic hydroperoxide reductase OsmC/OhrA
MSLRVAARARNFDLAAASLSGRCTETGHVKAIDLELRISTPEAEDKLKRLVEVAERGCHIRALVRDDVAVTLNVVRVGARNDGADQSLPGHGASLQRDSSQGDALG